MLAGGVSDDPRFEASHQLSTSTMMRLVEGIRLSRQIPDARLVVSGGQPFSTIDAASVMRSVAIGLGVPDSVIVVERQSLDTSQQAVALAPIVGDDPFLLVTSAMHMPRSMALFRGQNLAPVAAPTEFLARNSDSIHPGAFFPSSNNIRAARMAWREYLGLVWAGLRGQL